MVHTKAVRSALALLAICGTVAACSSNSGDNTPTTPAAQSVDGVTTLEVTQKASVKTSITDEAGMPVSLEAAANIGRVNAAEFARVQLPDGSLGTEIRLLAGPELVAKFTGDVDMNGLTTMDIPAEEAAVTLGADGKVSTMAFRLNDGRVLNVVMAFGAEQDQAKQDQSKQDQAKQDQTKQDQAKQDEPKQDEPKQDQAKQDQAKQDEAKQDEAKQDEAKQDEPKQDQAKQDEAKQDEPKQDQAKQDQAKQDQAKQDEPKQDQAKQDQAKQDEPKQDQAKQDQAKQDQAKQDQAKQDQAKQDQAKQDQAKQDEPKQEEKK